MEDAKTRKKRYSKVAKACKDCKAYKPRTKQQCKIYTLLLTDMKEDMVRNEHCFLEGGLACKGYVWDGK